MPRWPWASKFVAPARARLSTAWRRFHAHAAWRATDGSAQALPAAARHALHEVLEQLWPGVCFACRTGASQLALPLCTQCAAVLAVQRIPTPEISFWPRSGALRCFAAVSYEAQIRQWMHRFKYPAPDLLGLDPGPARLFASLIVEASRVAPRAEMIVPIPLHPARLRARGFNPALLLAKNLATVHHIPLATSVLRRIRDTPTQTELDPAQRITNVRGAFRAAETQIPLNARIWLVDDVITTGSTLAEAARELERAGAAEIFGISVARTPAFVEKNSANS